MRDARSLDCDSYGDSRISLPSPCESFSAPGRVGVVGVWKP